jgi:hypothetical protein
MNLLINNGDVFENINFEELVPEKSFYLIPTNYF